jgi:hypothetical protein
LVSTTEETRACLGCGFLERSKHLAGERPFPEAEVCPGYSTRLPEVLEASRALAWSNRGGIVPLYGNRELPPAFLDAVDCLGAAASKVERDIMRDARSRMSDGSAH